ncbi:Transcription factor with AP2 domain(S) [Plasmodium coatneyi]|uniref:Transcription factor with AP2 domain(S) n=1 Tax=Plasmodium coatneyi TaxID=208452 RepID=A0A1B1E336_9APIC|nr:Transcription factor with AP2 domain(S) [Plasmodium coatneyi]ANQ09415.1 Transcription factor with AP2 domain(S) [Plasmodium coatneyi]
MKERLNEGEEIIMHSGEEVHPSVSTKGQHIHEPTSFDKKAVNFNHMAHANYPFLLHTSDKGGSLEWNSQNAPYVNLASAYDPTMGLSISHPSGDKQSQIRQSNHESCMKSPMSNTPINTSNMAVTNGAGLNPNNGNFCTAMYSGGIPEKKESQKGYIGEDKNRSSKQNPLTPMKKNPTSVISYRNGMNTNRMRNATSGGSFTPNKNVQNGEADNLMIHQSRINHVQQDGLVGDKDETSTLLPVNNNSSDCLASMLSNGPEGYIQSVPTNYQMGWTCSNEWGEIQTQGVPPSVNNPNKQTYGISPLNSSTTSVPHNPCASHNFQFDKSSSANGGHLPSGVNFNNHPTSSLWYHPDGHHIGSRTNSIYLNGDMMKIPTSEDLHVIPPNGSTTSSGSYHVSGEGTNQINNPNGRKELLADQWRNEERLTKQANRTSYRIRRKVDSSRTGESYEMRSSEYEPTGQCHLQQGQPKFASSEGCIYPSGTPLINTCGSFPVRSTIREDDNFNTHMGSRQDGQPMGPPQGKIQFEEQMDNTYSIVKNPLTVNRMVRANNSTPVISNNLINSSCAPFVNNPVQNCQHLEERRFFPIKGNYCMGSIESPYPFGGNQMEDLSSFMKLYNNGNTEDDTEMSAWSTRGGYPQKEVLNSHMSNTKESHSSLIRSSGDGDATLHMCSSPGVNNMPQRSISSCSRQLSLLDSPNGVNNEQEETLQRQNMYDLYVQSLLNGVSGVTNPNGQRGERNDQLVLFNLKNMRSRITGKTPQMANNYLSYLDHYIASLRLLYNKLLSNRNLIFILAKEVFAPKRKRDKKKYSDDKAPTFDSKHSYVQELLAALLPQPPVFPPFEIWIYMGKKNASQLHKLHLTIYIIYQKIICNISNILLKINNDMVSYAGKNKFSKRNGTDSLNDYVNDNKGEGVKRSDSPFLSATKGEDPLGGFDSREYVAKREEGTFHVEDVDYLIDKADAVDSVNSIDAMCIPVEPERETIYNRRPSQMKENESNIHKGDIPRKCLFRIDQKLDMMMASIDNISKMMKLATKGDGRNSSKDPSVDSPDGENKPIDVGEDGNNIQQDEKSGLEKEGKMVKHAERVSEDISPSGCQSAHISINPKDGQIVAYDEVKSTDGPLLEKVTKLNYSNCLEKDNPVKLLNELKYELRNVYNEIRSLKRHHSYYLSSGNNGEEESSLELVNPNDDNGDDYGIPRDGSAVSNMKIKEADETCLLNDFLYSQSERSNPLVNAQTGDYYSCGSKKNEKKIKLKKQNELLNSLINSSICSNEQINKDIIYDLKYTDDIFKKLLFLCRNFYTNLSEYKDYALEPFQENEMGLTNLGHVNSFGYMDNQAFFPMKPLPPSGELPPRVDLPEGKDHPPMCKENGHIDPHSIEQVNGHPVKAEDDTSNVAPIIGSGGGDEDVNSGEETLLSDDQVGSTNLANYGRYTNLGGVCMYDASECSTTKSQDDLRGRNNPPWVELPMEKKEDKEGAHEVDSFFAKLDNQEELMEVCGETPQRVILQMGEMDNYAAAYNRGRNGDVLYSPFSKATNGDYAQMEVGFSSIADNVDDSGAVHAPAGTLFSTTQNGFNYSYPNEQHRGHAYSDIRSSFIRDTSHVNSEHPYVQRAIVSEGSVGSVGGPYVLVKDTEEITKQGTYMNNSYVQNDLGTAKNSSYLLSSAQNMYYPNEDNLPIGFENTEGQVRNDCAKYEPSVSNAYAVNTSGNMKIDDSSQRFSTPMTRCLNADGSYVRGDVMGNCLQVPHSVSHKNQQFGMFNCVAANRLAPTDTDLANHNGINGSVGYYTDESALPSMFTFQGVQNSFQNGAGKNDIRSDQFATNEATNNFTNSSDAGMINQFSHNDTPSMNMHHVDNVLHSKPTYRTTEEGNTFKDALNEGENFTEKIYSHNGNYFNNAELRDTIEDVSDNEVNSGGNPNLGEDENTFDEGSSYFLKNGVITSDLSDHWKVRSNFANNLNRVKSESWNGEDINVSNLKGEHIMRNNSPPDADISAVRPSDNQRMTNERGYNNFTNDANKSKLKKMLEITDKLIGKKYRGISYDPTRNGWSTFVYKNGVRRKKFFSSYKYGNLLAKKKSIEWRLKNLSPDSHAYVFSLKAKEEFNAILNDGYADINNLNCDSRDGENNGNSSNNRDILYVNAFINLFNSSSGGKKGEPDVPDEPLCRMDKSSYEECAEELTRKDAQDGNGPGSSEHAKSLGHANDKVGGDIDENTDGGNKGWNGGCGDARLNGCDEADGCLPPNGDLFAYENYCSILLNEEEASRSEPNGREAKNDPTCNNVQKDKVDNLNGAAGGEIPDQTAHFQIVNGQNEELTKFPHSNDVSAEHCAALPKEGIDPRLPIGDNYAVARCGNRKKRKRNILKGEGKNPIGEGEPDVTGTGENFRSTYAGRDASAGGCSDSSCSDPYGSDTRSCDDQLDGNRIDENFKRSMDSSLTHTMEGIHSPFEEEGNICKNGKIRYNNSEESLQYVKECISKNIHLKGFSCGSGGKDNNKVDTLYNNVGCYPDGNRLSSGQPLLNGVFPTSDGSVMKTFYPVECKSIPQEQLIGQIVNPEERQHMDGKEKNNLFSGEITPLVEGNSEMEKQVVFPSEETEGRSPNVLDCSMRGDSFRGTHENGSPNGTTEVGASHHEGDLFVKNKQASDKNCFLYKDTLLRYMNECTCTGEEEKNVFLHFLRLTPEWVLLELDQLEEKYHAYFRKKIESFYKAYLVKISNQNGNDLREVPEEGSCRSASGIPPRRNEYLRELQLIFDKKLNTLWTCMIFPIDFLYILNYKILRILKTLNKKKVQSAKQEKDKQLQCSLKGVSFIKYKSAWCFTYLDLDDKKKEKIFPINHYGFMEAKTLSILYRKSFVLHLSKMYTFLRNILSRHKLESTRSINISKLINPKSINQFIDYYKKYEEFLLCYGKILYFNESKNIFLSMKETTKKRDALNYVPPEMRHKMSGEIEPLNLITVTRNYFSKKSQMIKFPKGVVYLSGYFLWVLLFLNHNNKEVVISFSARKYSFETAKSRCFECYYFLLYKYKFRPINISGVIDLILETDLECKNYNLLDYEAEKIMPLDCLFYFFAPSNYVLQNGVIYKRLLLDQHNREGYLWREEYNSLFPSEYVSLDTFQRYEIEDDYFVATNEVDVPLNGCMESGAEVVTQDNLLNDAEAGAQRKYSPFEFPSLPQHQAACYTYHPIEHNEGNEYPAKKHHPSVDDLLLCDHMEQEKKDIPLYFTDDENGKMIRLKRGDRYLGRSFKRGNYTNWGDSPEEYHLGSDSGGDEEAAPEQAIKEEEKKTHGAYDPSGPNNEDITMCRREGEGMTSWGMHLTCGNSNVGSLHGGHNIEEEHQRGGNYPTVNGANRRGQNGQVSSDTIGSCHHEEGDYHLGKKEERNGDVIEQNLHTKEYINHEQTTQTNFINNAEYYRNILSKSIFHFFDNNIQDEYLKRNYDSLFNSEEEKNVVFKKISEKEEQVGVFLMLNCQWLSDSFVHNIHQIETKYADIYSFENYLNTREEVLNWKCEKNFIRDCGDIAKKCPRVIGVYYDTHTHAWVVSSTFNGKRRDKKFLVKTFGFLQARKMAIEYREKCQQQRALYRAKNVHGKRVSYVETDQMETNEQ